MVSAPVASPSTPSVRFTAFEDAITMKVIHTIAATSGSRNHSMSRVKEMAVLAGVSP